MTWTDDCVTPANAGALFGGGLSAEAALDAEVEQGRAAIEASKRAGVNFIVASTLEVRTGKQCVVCRCRTRAWTINFELTL